MPNDFFQFKQFRVEQDQCAMKVCTDSCIFGAWAAAVADIQTKRILDIGTGTGLLSLMLAQYLPSSIDAVELDESAAEQAKSNFKNSPWKERLQVHPVSIQEFVSNESYDLIISNPPFFENDLHSDDERVNQARHEGTLDLSSLLVAVQKHLTPRTGTAFILYPYQRASQLIDEAEKHGLYPSFLMAIKHQPEKEHFRMICQFKTEKTANVQVASLSIRDEKDYYSDAFYTLLSPYYLNL